MSAAIGLRGDFDVDPVRAAAKRSKDGPQARRLLALAAIYDGADARRSGEDWRRRIAGCSRLGGQVQRAGPGRPD